MNRHDVQALLHQPSLLGEATALELLTLSVAEIAAETAARPHAKAAALMQLAIGIARQGGCDDSAVRCLFDSANRNYALVEAAARGPSNEVAP